MHQFLRSRATAINSSARVKPTIFLEMVPPRLKNKRVGVPFCLQVGHQEAWANMNKGLFADMACSFATSNERTLKWMPSGELSIGLDLAASDNRPENMPAADKQINPPKMTLFIYVLINRKQILLL